MMAAVVVVLARALAASGVVYQHQRIHALIYCISKATHTSYNIQKSKSNKSKNEIILNSVHFHNFSVFPDIQSNYVTLFGYAKIPMGMLSILNFIEISLSFFDDVELCQLDDSDLVYTVSILKNISLRTAVAYT